MARDAAYHQAELRIEKARQSGAAQLDLKEMRLSELPASIASLTQLKELSLRDNQLSELPESIASLTQLRLLDLRDNQLSELPESIASLTQLRELFLSDNQLSELPESIASLTQLQVLYLLNNQLSELPESIASLTQLQYLYLQYNQLSELPASIASLTQLRELDLDNNQLSELPESIASLTQLRELFLSNNQLSELPKSIASLTQLQVLYLLNNQLSELPESIASLTQLQYLYLQYNQLSELPASIASLTQLRELDLDNNQLSELPKSIASLTQLQWLGLGGNPLNPDLAAAHEQGIEAVLQYLRAKAEQQVTLNEAKLILVGEGEVGKSCLLGALRGDEWLEGRPTTHGIEIKPVLLVDAVSGTEMTLNGWDFGGQRVYRPTHQLFFSAPAVYLVVWKPREGPQQGFVKEWITLIKRREPDAKVLVVATHGGPGQRQPDIDRQELLAQFGSDTIIDFFHIDSKPSQEKSGAGVDELRKAIAQTAMSLPEVGRSVPAKWQRVREILQASEHAYLSYSAAIACCQQQGMDDEQADLFLRISPDNTAFPGKATSSAFWAASLQLD